MTCLLLWLEGPLQAWGGDSRFDLRRTLPFPTRSGLFGLLLAASGDSGPQEELLARMDKIALKAVSFKSDTPMLEDFHMVGAGYDEKDRWQSMNIPKKYNGKPRQGPGTKLTYRHYLQDRVFAAMLEMEDALMAKFAAALQNPVFDLYLGRKCCVPTELIFQGEFPDFAAATAKMLTIATSKKLEPDKVIAETGDFSVPDALLLSDVPVSFGTHKHYRERLVTMRPWTDA